MKNRETITQNPEEQKQEAFPGTDEKDQMLEMRERFDLQLGGVINHYTEAYNQIPDASRDPKEVKRAIREFIEDKGLFVPTAKDRSEYSNPNLADDALEKTLRLWKEKSVKETLTMLQLLGKVDPERKKDLASKI